MRGSVYSDYQYFPQNENEITHFYLSALASSDTGLFDLRAGMDTVRAWEGMMDISTARGLPLADHVISMASRSQADGKPHLFFIQQSADGEGYRLMGCKVTKWENSTILYWTLRDYDTDMPRTDLQWTKPYDRECLYWMETAGQTEDVKGNLFKVRAVWYDETADAVSEPFVIATVQTPHQGWHAGGYVPGGER